jgi:serine/threonine-protein kinase HipA
MMDRNGNWDLSPAYDLVHSEGSDFTRNHQLSINGKTKDFERSDLKHLAQYAGLPRGSEKQIIQRTVEVFAKWQDVAVDLGIPAKLQQHVLRTLRLKI